MDTIPDRLYFKIGEVSRITGLKPYILRYWESELKIVQPRKTSSGQRIYTKKDVELISKVKRLVNNEKFTLEGAKKRIRELGKECNTVQPINNNNERYKSLLRSIRADLVDLRDRI